MISVADNFSYQGSKPLDGRIKYDTVAAMKAVADASMYDGCLAYCVATDKTYQWKSTNSVDSTTGKWREFSSGSELVIEQVDSMPAPSATWYGKSLQFMGTNTNDFVKGNIYTCDKYSDTENYFWQVVATAVGNLDFKTDDFTCSYESAKKGKLTVAISGAYKPTDTAETTIDNADKFPFYDVSASAKRHSTWSNLKSKLQTFFDTVYQKPLVAGSNINFSGTDNLTINAEMPMIGTINRSDIYSTTEKIIGCWTDGRPLYQKVVTTTLPTAVTDGEIVLNYVSMGVSISTFVSCEGFLNLSGAHIYFNKTYSR